MRNSKGFGMGTHEQPMRRRKRQAPQLRTTILLVSLALFAALSVAILPVAPTVEAAPRTWDVRFGCTIHEVWEGQGKKFDTPRQGGKPDFFTVCKISGKSYTSSTIVNQNHIKPNWTLSRLEKGVFAGPEYGTMMELSIRDRDDRDCGFLGIGGCDWNFETADINPSKGKNLWFAFHPFICQARSDLGLQAGKFVTPERCELTPGGDLDVHGNEGKIAHVKFTIWAEIKGYNGGVSH